MRIISRKALRRFWARHADAKGPLNAWYSMTKKAQWESLADAKKDFPHADLVGVCTSFNIKGNDYRLIAKIYYGHRKVYIRFIMTHAEYDKGEWKNDCRRA
jgi:mRNA interferase HigB